MNRDVLMARSPVFKAKLSHDTPENQSSEIKIEDIEDDVLQVMAEFIDSDIIDPENLKDYAHKLLAAAVKYKVNSLQQLCINHLVASLDRSNIRATFELADITNSQSLKSACVDMLIDQAMDNDFLKDLISSSAKRPRTE